MAQDTSSKKSFFSQIRNLFGQKNQTSNNSIRETDLPSAIIPPERPTEVLLKIGVVYREKNRQVLPTPSFVLNPNYFYTFIDISGYDCIVSYFQTTGLSRISVLDIGTGDVSFARKIKQTFGDKVDITIISPLPPQQEQDTLDNSIHLVNGNAEYLYMLTGANKFDVILSSQAFVQFVDPLGNFQQLYQALVPGGLLFIDEFYLPGIHDQLPHLCEEMNANGYAMVMDYLFGIDDISLTIVGVKSLILKKTLSQFIIPGITYAGIKEEATIAASIHAAYAITPPLRSFKKHVPVEAEAFIHLIHSLIPSISETEIAGTLFNIFILNAPYNEEEKNAYEPALHTSLQTLLTKYHVVSEDHIEEIRKAETMISFIGKWFSQIKNKDAFMMEVQQRLGLNLV